MVTLSLLIIVLTLSACSTEPKTEAQPAQGKGVRLDLVASGLSSPVYVTAPDGDPRIFIVEQVGIVRIVKDGKLLPAPFISLTDRIRAGGERGLLSRAFHSD